MVLVVLESFRRSDPCPWVGGLFASPGYSFIANGAGVSSGGTDIRKTTRKTLLAAGAPIRAGTSARVKRRRRRTSGVTHPNYSECTKWINRQFRLIKRKFGPVGRAEYTTVYQTLLKRWNEHDLMDACSDVESQVSDNEGAARKSYDELIGNSLFGISSQDTPILPDVLIDTGEKLQPTNGKTMGFTTRFDNLWT